MFDLLRYPRLLALLAMIERGRTAYRGRRDGSRRADRNRDRFYAQCWRDAATALGGTIEPLGDEIFEIALDWFSTRVCRNYTAIDDPVTLLLAGSRPATYRRLAAVGVPIAEHLEFTLHTALGAAEFLERTGAPCVVKPARDTGAGCGVTSGITRHSHLVKAIATAAACTPELLIEKQVLGDVYRLLYLDGVLLDAVVRQPLTVINDNSAMDHEAAADRLCPAIIETGAAAACAVGARLAGVDVITTDPSQPLHVKRGVVLEVNTTPGFFYHYRRRGKCCPVAIHLLESLRTHRDSPSFREKSISVVTGLARDRFSQQAFATQSARR